MTTTLSTNRDHLISTITRLTYKPNWDIRVDLPEHGRAGCIPVIVQAYLEDSTKPAKIFPERERFAVRVHIPEDWSTTKLLDYLRSGIRSAELHEVDEWLKLDDAHVTAPHVLNFSSIPDDPQIELVVGAMPCERGWFLPE